MARPLRTDYEGAIHHLYDRGNAGQAIFRDDPDRREFSLRLVRYGREFDVSLLADCLMTTHFHLVPVTGREPLEKFMHALLTSYTRYYNDRWLTRGHLFQGRYQARRCKTDIEVRTAIRYVHMNPVEARMVTAPEQWAWSSARGYLSGEDELTDVVAGLSYFGTPNSYCEFMSQPLAKEERPQLRDIALKVAGEAGLSLMLSPARIKEASEMRRDFIVLARRYYYRNNAIAKFLGRSPSAISMLMRVTN